MEYYYLFILLFVVVVAILYHISAVLEREEWEKREQRIFRRMHVDYIKKTFPRAFKEYWGNPDKANAVYKKFSNIMLNKDCINWTENQWKKLEDYLFEQQQHVIDRNFWLMTQLDEIKNKYPHGLSIFLKQGQFSFDKNPAAIIEIIIKNLNQIENLEREFSNSKNESSA